MTPTVDDLRNEIRRSVGRFERATPTGFTKEDLAAIREAVDDEYETGRLPPTSQQRAAILRNVDVPEGSYPERVDRQFRKAELEAIAAAVRNE